MTSKTRYVNADIKEKVINRYFGGRICSNIPDSPLSKLIGSHCMSYNLFLNDNFGLSHLGTTEIEHMIPFSKGKSNQNRNLHMLCSNCHSIKTRLELKHRNIKDDTTGIPNMLDEEVLFHTINFRHNFIFTMKDYMKKHKLKITQISRDNLNKLINSYHFQYKNNFSTTNRKRKRSKKYITDLEERIHINKKLKLKKNIY